MTTSFPSRLLVLAACAGAFAVAGCNKAADTPAPLAAPPAPVASAPVPPPVPAYVPPTAEQLDQMVAPIAIYPDSLVAQVLAGATYPDQVTTADQWLAQNAKLQGGPLADAAEQQPWDPSIKSLTAFRRVLDQMANNLPWTTALGQAYYNDPAGVFSAIQVMRQRATQAGQLKTTAKLRVVTRPASAASPTPVITIVPAQPDVVYVPSYDPQRIYGTPVAAYPGYVWSPPAYVEPAYVTPGYSNAQVVTAGALSFGVGVVVGAALERHDWGWHAWGLNWGRPAFQGGGVAPPQAAAAFERPAVVYNRSTYVSRSSSVVNTVVNNNVRNNFVNEAPSQQQQQQRMQAQLAREQQQQQQQQQQQAQLGQLREQQSRQAQGQQALAQQEAQQRSQQQQAQRQARQQQAAGRLQAQQNQQAQMRQQQDQLHRQQTQQAQAHQAEQARQEQQQAQQHQMQMQQQQAHDQQQRQQVHAQARQQRAQQADQARHLQQQQEQQQQHQAEQTRQHQMQAQQQAHEQQHAQMQAQAHHEQQQHQAHAAAARAPEHRRPEEPSR